MRTPRALAVIPWCLRALRQWARFRWLERRPLLDQWRRLTLRRARQRGRPVVPRLLCDVQALESRLSPDDPLGLGMAALGMPLLTSLAVLLNGWSPGDLPEPTAVAGPRIKGGPGIDWGVWAGDSDLRAAFLPPGAPGTPLPTGESSPTAPATAAPTGERSGDAPPGRPFSDPSGSPFDIDWLNGVGLAIGSSSQQRPPGGGDGGAHGGGNPGGPGADTTSGGPSSGGGSAPPPEAGPPEPSGGGTSGSDPRAGLAGLAPPGGPSNRQGPATPPAPAAPGGPPSAGWLGGTAPAGPGAVAGGAGRLSALSAPVSRPVTRVPFGAVKGRFSPLDPSGNTFLTEYGLPTGVSPYGITNGPDGNLWFVGQGGGSQPNTGTVGRISATGVYTIWSASHGALPKYVATGEDNQVWFTELIYAAVLGTTPVPNVSVTDTVIDPYAFPGGITAGPAGSQTIWFTLHEQSVMHQSAYVAKINTDGTGLQEYLINSTGVGVGKVTLGPDENIWFTEPNANQVGRINPDGTGLQEWVIPTANSQPYGIAAGEDGNLWFTENNGNKIGRITTAGAITEYSTGLSAGANPRGIAPGPQGARDLWFTEPGVNKVAEITTAGKITEFNGLAAGSSPEDIVTGPDFNIWFTEPGSNNVAVLRLLRVNPYDFTATEGQALTSQAVAWVQVPVGGSAASPYTATIDWGDGTPLDTTTPAVVPINAGGGTG